MQMLTLTYAELADRMGVREDSARKTAKRKRWAMTRGNDGRMRVQVPLDELTTAPAPLNPDQAMTIARLEASIAGLEAEMARADEQRRAADERAEQWRLQAQRSIASQIWGRINRDTQTEWKPNGNRPD
jgi:hypothetical protein